MALDHHVIRAVGAVHAPQKDAFVRAARGDDLPVRAEFGGEDLGGVAREEHDGGVELGGALGAGRGRVLLVRKNKDEGRGSEFRERSEFRREGGEGAFREGGFQIWYTTMQ